MIRNSFSAGLLFCAVLNAQHNISLQISTSEGLSARTFMLPNMQPEVRMPPRMPRPPSQNTTVAVFDPSCAYTPWGSSTFVPGNVQNLPGFLNPVCTVQTVGIGPGASNFGASWEFNISSLPNASPKAMGAHPEAVIGDEVTKLVTFTSTCSLAQGPFGIDWGTQSNSGYNPETGRTELGFMITASIYDQYNNLVMTGLWEVFAVGQSGICYPASCLVPCS